MELHQPLPSHLAMTVLPVVNLVVQLSRKRNLEDSGGLSFRDTQIKPDLSVYTISFFFFSLLNLSTTIFSWIETNGSKGDSVARVFVTLGF